MRILNKAQWHSHDLDTIKKSIIISINLYKLCNPHSPLCALQIIFFFTVLTSWRSFWPEWTSEPPIFYPQINAILTAHVLICSRVLLSIQPQLFNWKRKRYIFSSAANLPCKLTNSLLSIMRNSDFRFEIVLPRTPWASETRVFEKFRLNFQFTKQATHSWCAYLQGM